MDQVERQSIGVQRKQSPNFFINISFSKGKKSLSTFDIDKGFFPLKKDIFGIFRKDLWSRNKLNESNLNFFFPLFFL